MPHRKERAGHFRNWEVCEKARRNTNGIPKI
jgi:hypothetical protein